MNKKIETLKKALQSIGIKKFSDNNLGKRTWYHSTDPKNLESILKNGLKINSPANYSKAFLEYMKNVYGMIPIFIAKSPEPYDGDLKAVVLAIDVSGLDLVSDIPTLISHYGAYIEEDGIWFKEGDLKAPSWANEEDEILFDDLLDHSSDYCKSSIETTGTAAVISNVPPESIRILQ
jgi:hypothetical protein